MRLQRAVFLLVALLAVLPSSVAAIEPTFRARLTIDLCAAYRSGAALELEYQVGSGEVRALSIVRQEISAQKDRGTFDVLLPSTYGTTPFYIRAYCRKGPDRSASSNAVSLSNCDALARLDTDGDGISNRDEDINCDNSFSPGDLSNPDNVDTDGDGVRDLVERLEGFDPNNPGSSPRPTIFSDGPFDPDMDGNANPYVFRPWGGMWFIRDFFVPGNHIALQFGIPGDIPFAYRPSGYPSNVGVIRLINNQLHWFFNGVGFETNTGGRINSLPFGVFGDNIILGPWEMPGVTSPAVARLYQGNWWFFIYKRDGTIHSQTWGGNGDIPKPADYDGDGIFDISVFRPSEQKTYVIRSSDRAVRLYQFGTGTADHTVRGDVTGDGVEDLSFWEPASGMFTALVSDYQFDVNRAKQRKAPYYFEMQLGLYGVHVPLSWNRQNGKVLFTVIDHQTGMRYTRPYNDPSGAILPMQWGLPGDAFG